MSSNPPNFIEGHRTVWKFRCPLSPGNHLSTALGQTITGLKGASSKGYDHAVLWHRCIHPSPRRCETWTHNVGSAENKLDSTFVYLQLGEDEWVWGQREEYKYFNSGHILHFLISLAVPRPSNIKAGSDRAGQSIEAGSPAYICATVGALVCTAHHVA